VQLRLTGRMPLGREKVKLQWQVAPLTSPFTSSTVISGTSAQWTDVLTTGKVITQNVTALTPDTPYHWRMRLLYRPGNPLGQRASRWIHVPWNGWTETDFRTLASAGTTTTTRTITYTYDPLNRLTGADYRSTELTAGPTGESFAYQYDAVGNRTVMTDATGVTTYTYDAANRLTSVGDVSYTWDARGNLVSDGTFTYTYNAAGRLVRAESVTVTLVYTYTSAAPFDSAQDRLGAGTADGLRVAQSVKSCQSAVKAAGDAERGRKSVPGGPRHAGPVG